MKKEEIEICKNVIKVMNDMVSKEVSIGDQILNGQKILAFRDMILRYEKELTEFKADKKNKLEVKDGGTK